MDKSDFFNRIMKKYTKDFNQYDLEDIKRFVSTNYHNDDFEPLYNAIVERYNYQKLPPVSLFREICDERGSRPVGGNKWDEIIKHNRAVSDAWTIWPTGKIIYFLSYINGLEERTATEIEFWGTYSPLFWEMRYMQDANYSKEAQREHLDYVKDALVKGWNYNSIISKEQYKINFKGLFKENLNKEERFT